MIITAAPSCTAALAEAVKSLGLEEELRVLDLAELVSTELS